MNLNYEETYSSILNLRKQNLEKRTESGEPSPRKLRDFLQLSVF